MRLVSDPSVVSLLARNWKSFLFLPPWSWEGPLSHLGLSQPWSKPFCWKFVSELIALVLSASSPRQIIPRHFFKAFLSFFLFFLVFCFCFNLLFVFWVKVFLHASLSPSILLEVVVSYIPVLFLTFLIPFIGGSSPGNERVKCSFKICMHISN